MLARYMMSGPDDEVVYPSDRQVVDIMDSAGGASEDKVVLCLAYLRNERGLQPGTRNAPPRATVFRVDARSGASPSSYARSRYGLGDSTTEGESRTSLHETCRPHGKGHSQFLRS